jgi:hypothetical protein
MIIIDSHCRIRKHDVRLGELGNILEPFFERAFREAFASVQLYRVGESVYVRGRRPEKLLAVGFFDGWMIAMRDK